MPVRKIPRNHIHVTGQVPGTGKSAPAEFESLLERDFLLLLRFDRSVDKFDVQPIAIPLSSPRRTYTPDVLIHWKPRNGRIPKPHLVEVKPKFILERDESELAPKFAAATALCHKRGWVFRVVAEDQIQTPRLENCKFLRDYQRRAFAGNDIHRALAAVRELKAAATIDRAIARLASDATDEDRLALYPLFWHLIAVGGLQVNLGVALSVRTHLRPPRSDDGV